MSLLFPAYLLGLAGLALPWLLHRFSDQRPEEQSFPSKRFLEPTTPPVSRTRHLKYLALLALRVLSLLLLCLLFAQPWISRDTVAGSARTHHLVAIDRSLSMRAQGRWSRAIDEAHRIIDEVPTADTVELVAFDTTLQRLATDEVSETELNLALSSLQPGYATADYGITMQRLDKLAALQDVPVKLWLITDEQATALPAQLNALYAPQVTELSIRSILDVPQRNVHLKANAVSSDGVNVELTAQLMASIDSSDASPSDTNDVDAQDSTASSVTLQVSFEDQLLAERRVGVTPGKLETVVFDGLVLPASRQPSLNVAIAEPDALTEDNEVQVVVRTANPTPVALLESERGASRNAQVFLATAMETDGLAQVEAMQGTAERVGPETQHMVTARKLDARIDMDVLQFVDTGRNALVFRSDAATDSGGQSVRGTEMGLVDDAHPLSLGEMDWAGTRFYDVAAMNTVDGDRVLLQTEDRLPVLIERPTPRGRLLILNDRLDGIVSNLPLQPAFVSLMQSILHYFDASTALPDQVIAGNRLALPANVQVLDPEGTPLLTLDASARTGSIELMTPGLYKVIGARGEHELQVVLDPRESDLTRMQAMALDTWQARYAESDTDARDTEAETGAGHSSRALDPLLMAQGTDATRLSVWRYVLPLFVLLLLLESGFANRRLDVRRDGS